MLHFLTNNMYVKVLAESASCRLTESTRIPCPPLSATLKVSNQIFLNPDIGAHHNFIIAYGSSSLEKMHASHYLLLALSGLTCCGTSIGSDVPNTFSDLLSALTDIGYSKAEALTVPRLQLPDARTDYSTSLCAAAVSGT